MLNELAEQINDNARNKGWWDEPRTTGDILMLCTCELAEAMEELRNGHRTTEVYYNEDNPEKPEGIPIELADTIIRILDFCSQRGIDIDSAIKVKMAFNETRPYKHGGKVL